jgi:hypothetical protein
MGYTAAVLAQHKLTGLVVSVTNVTQIPSMWRCAGIPILALLDALPREGFQTSDLIVKSADVDINGKTF